MLNKEQINTVENFVKDKIKSKMFFVSAKNKSGLKDMCDNITEYMRN